jgi:MFS family permease
MMTRWHVLALLFLARVGVGFQFQTLASVSGDLSAAFGLDHAQIGLLIGLFMAPGAVLAVPAGYGGRYLTDRSMIVAALGLLALGGIVSSLAVDSTVIGLGRVLAGAGFLVTNIYFTKMVADWFEGREFATAMSILVMSWPFGIAMGQIGHAWLAAAFGWQAAFQVASAYCLVAAVAVLALYRPPHDLLQVAGGGSPRLLAVEWQLVICAGLAWGVFNAAYVIYLSFGPQLLESLGQSALAAAGVISVGSWLMIFSGALCGQIVDRIGRRLTVLTLCMAGAVISLWLLRVPGAGLGASLLFGLVGMAPAGVIMAMTGRAMRPQLRAFGMGVFFTVYYLVVLVTPPVAGAILDITGSTLGPIHLAMAMFAAVIPLALLFERLRRGAAALAA